MKKINKISVSMLMFRLCLNNYVFAATNEVQKNSNDSYAKFVFIGVAALVIILLLFLGYKMDTNDNGNEKRETKKINKEKEKIFNKVNSIKQNEGSYEADTEAYEADGLDFKNEDFNSSIEYKEDDDEDSLYSTSSEKKENEEDDDYTDSDYTNYAGGFGTDSTVNIPIPTNIESTETKEEPEIEKEEFDTSIIDNLDIDDSKKSFDETMLFNNSDFSATGNSLEEEIDNLDTIKEENKVDDSQDFLEELKKFEQPESTFEGFSVASNEDSIEEFNDKEENMFSLNEESNLDDDFISQMEATLKKNKESRKTKKVTKSTTKKTTKKKEDK